MCFDQRLRQTILSVMGAMILMIVLNVQIVIFSPPQFGVLLVLTEVWYEWVGSLMAGLRGGAGSK